MPTKDYQTDLLKRLANAEYAAQYLKVAFDEALVEGDKSAFLLALKNVIDANGGIQTLANKAKVSDHNLYQMLNEEKNTTLEKL